MKHDRDEGMELPRGCGRRNVWLAWVLLAAGLILTILATLYMRSAVDGTEKRDFAFACDQAQLKIDERLIAYEQILRSGAALFYASDMVTREEWRSFTGNLRVEQNLPGIQGIGFALLIPRGRLAQHLQDIRGEGFPGYQVWPEGDRETYSSIIYLEPFSGLNLRAFGYDMFSEPVRRAAMERARDQDEAALSGKVILVQETEKDVQAGTLMYVPVYRRGMPSVTIEQRRASLQGWVYSPYRMNDFMRGILGNGGLQEGKPLHLQVYDGEMASPDTLLYDSPAAGDKDLATASRFILQIPFDVAGRRWTLRFTQTSGPIFAAEYSRVWLVLSGGTIISLLLSALIFYMRNTQFRTRQMAEQLSAALSESRFRLDIALSGSDLGMWDWNILTGKIDRSEHWAEMLGYSLLKEIEPNVATWERLVHPEDLPAVQSALDSHLRGETSSYVSEYRMRHKDGHWVWIHDSGKVVERSADGAPIRAAGTFLDITERNKAEDEIVKSVERYRSTLDQMFEGCQTLGFDWSYLYLNAAAEKHNRRPNEELLGRKYMDMWPGVEDTEVFVALRRCMEDRIASQMENEFIFPDGRTGWFELSIQPVREGVFILSQDITERKQAEAEHEKLEAQFRQAQKMEAVGRLAGGVAHDFNNMLQVIISYAELVLGKLTPPDPLHAAVQQIMKAGRRSADLAGQLLAFARKQIIAPKILDLNESVEGMLKMLQRLIGEDIDLAFVPGHDLGKVKMDPSQVDQILANLAVNARDAISSVGKVTMETDNAEFDENYCKAHNGFLPGQYVLLAVSDDGCGMDKQTQSRLFEPFFTTKPQGQGTGLGLATVYGIVKQNNGFINVYSEPGMGTTFKIYLQRLQSDTAVIDETPEHAVAMNGTETVLLVDDEEALLELGKMMLEEGGYTALTAGSPSQAIQRSEQFAGDIHLLLTDVVMPGMSGRELFQRLSTLRPGLKCLFMSGYTADAISHRGVLDGGIHFLQKPFSVEQLAVKLREALNEPHRG
jgi:PAS domain S-box-containing protein